MPLFTMHIFTTASATLASAEKEIMSHKIQSDVRWYFFLVILLSNLLVAQPDQRQSAGHKLTGLATSRVMLQAR